MVIVTGGKGGAGISDGVGIGGGNGTYATSVTIAKNAVITSAGSTPTVCLALLTATLTGGTVENTGGGLALMWQGAPSAETGFLTKFKTQAETKIVGEYKKTDYKAPTNYSLIAEVVDDAPTGWYLISSTKSTVMEEEAVLQNLLTEDMEETKTEMSEETEETDESEGTEETEESNESDETEMPEETEETEETEGSTETQTTEETETPTETQTAGKEQNKPLLKKDEATKPQNPIETEMPEEEEGE